MQDEWLIRRSDSQSDRLTRSENYSDEGYSQEVGLESPTYVIIRAFLVNFSDGR